MTQTIPLTETYRPTTFQDMCGQSNIIGPNGILTRMLDQNRLQSVIFYGPPGCGKTTAARIIASQANITFVSMNATNASIKDIQTVMKNKESNTSPILLYLDEIQYFNKKQQQALLPYIESGDMIFIGATTDNPYYTCYDALLSRCLVLEFQPISIDDMELYLHHIANQEQRPITDDAVQLIAENSAGDVRRGVNQLNEALIQYPTSHIIDEDDIKALLPRVRMSGFDTNADDHYSLISGLQKSIRGSDPNAAIFYLARLLEGGDLLSPCRRLLVIAHEDIGLAQPDAAAYVLACVETAKQLGLPEANKPLTNAVLYLAISPKASTCEKTYYAAVEDVKAGRGNIIPKHLRHAYSKGYDSPHNHPNHWVSQQYLPDDIKDHIYYMPGDNDFERNCAMYWSRIMK